MIHTESKLVYLSKSVTTKISAIIYAWKKIGKMKQVHIYKCKKKKEIANQVFLRWEQKL